MPKYSQYQKLSASFKEADNFLRNYNNQLKKAYNKLGENSTIYQNLKDNVELFASENGLQLGRTANGIYQISRSNKNINAITVRHSDNKTLLDKFKNKYYNRDKNKTIKRHLNVTQAYNDTKFELKAMGIDSPNNYQIQVQSQFDNLVNMYFQAYKADKGITAGVNDNEGYVDERYITVQQEAKSLRNAINNIHSQAERDRIMEKLEKLLTGDISIEEGMWRGETPPDEEFFNADDLIF